VRQRRVNCHFWSLSHRSESERHGRQRSGLHLCRHERNQRGGRPETGSTRSAKSQFADPAQFSCRACPPRRKRGCQCATKPDTGLHIRSGQNSTFGTIEFRKRFTNNSGAPSRECGSASLISPPSRRRQALRPAGTNIRRWCSQRC
jgi:hypothetical protein